MYITINGIFNKLKDSLVIIIATKKLVMFNNEEEFNKIYRENYKYLLKVAYVYLKQNVLITMEDVVDEVFLDIWKRVVVKKNEIKIKYTIRSYLAGAVRYKCFKYNNTQNEHNVNDDFILELPESYQTEEELNFKELKQNIKKIMNDKMTDRKAEVFGLRFFDGFSYKKIAEKLGLSIKTVGNHMGRALEIMRRELKKLGYF